jgi:hypothetical protein
LVDWTSTESTGSAAVTAAGAGAALHRRWRLGHVGESALDRLQLAPLVLEVSGHPRGAPDDDEDDPSEPTRDEVRDLLRGEAGARNADPTEDDDDGAGQYEADGDDAIGIGSEKSLQIHSNLAAIFSNAKRPKSRMRVPRASARYAGAITTRR